MSVSIQEMVSDCKNWLVAAGEDVDDLLDGTGEETLFVYNPYNGLHDLRDFLNDHEDDLDRIYAQIGREQVPYEDWEEDVVVFKAASDPNDNEALEYLLNIVERACYDGSWYYEYRNAFNLVEKMK